MAVGNDAVGNDTTGLEIGTKSEHIRRMSFVFIHTADWQIGKPFGRVPEDTAVLLRAARLDAIDRVAGAAAAADARHVLVAGDVFDHPKPPQRTVGQLLARLAEHRDIAWHLLPGNHDPAQPGTVWDDVAHARPAANIRCYTKPEAVEIEPGVLLLPAPLHAKAMNQDPTAHMDSVASARGTIRIGMAHGSVRGFDSLGEASIPIEPSRATSAQLDYLALGDWHGLTRIDGRTWYSGTPEPDGYKDNKPGHVLVVKIAEAGAAADVRPVATGHYQWRRHALTVTSLADVERFAAMIAAEPVPRARLLLKVDLTGRVPLAEFGAVTACLAALRNGLADLDADTSALGTRTGADDIASLGNGSTALIAARLAAMSADGEGAEQQTATRALRLLAQFAEQTP